MIEGGREGGRKEEREREKKNPKRNTTLMRETEIKIFSLNPNFTVGERYFSRLTGRCSN